MTKILPLGALALSFLLAAPAPAPAAGKGPVGTKADFRLKTLDGKMLGPKDFPGQVVVIDFWATWCGPCQIQAKILEPIYRDHKGRGVQFLAANVGEDVETVKKFVKGKPFPYPIILDPDDKVASNLGVLALPTLVVIDKKGKVSTVHSGLADGDTIRKAIKAAS